MKEGEQGKSWLIWLLIVPVAMAAGVLLTKWALQPGRAAPAAQAETQAEPSAGAVNPFPAPAAPKPAAADSAGYDLPGDEPAGGEAGIIWKDKPSAESASREGSRPPAPAAPAAGKQDPKESRTLGFAYGALTEAAGKLLNNPKAVSALLNNEYVVKGFMSRDTVKNATRNSASLANYLKNPANMNKFMGKEAVQRGMNNQELVNAVATSGLVAAMIDTPGGRGLLKDPQAIAEVLQTNPGLIDVLTNPSILNALVSNPKTAGVVTQINMAGIPR
ncbi:MAG: hypothetical protein Q8O90_09420 [Elusimicrobiota bacterium]|nr:hypothetical protein [Elusimicrobiota bacterium]